MRGGHQMCIDVEVNHKRWMNICFFCIWSLPVLLYLGW
jgi:hypothetical protein